jgi:hypothetical protein
MQREAEYDQQEESKTSAHNAKSALRETLTHGVASLKSSEATSEPASSNQKSKQSSLYTRLKRRIRKKDL